MSRVFSSANKNPSENNIQTPSSAAYNNLSAFTWSTWVYPTASPDSDSSTILVKDPVNTYLPVLQFNANGTTTLIAEAGSPGTPAMTVSNELLTLNAWSNVIITFDNSGDKLIHLYVNGTAPSQNQSASVGSLGDDSAAGYVFGNDTFDDGWDGRLAEMALWNTVLSGAQITAVAASTTGVGSIQSANLVGYWHLCGTASPEPDSSGNNNSGVLSSNPPTAGPNSPGFNCSAAPSFPQGNSPLGNVNFSSDQYGNIRLQLQTGNLA